MSEFKRFGEAVNKQLEKMSSDGELFVVEPPLDLFESYLSAFPQGTNPMFRQRTEHDCSCCKNFIRNFGRVVSLDPKGNMITIWDVKDLPDHYQAVANAMSDLIHQQRVVSPFRTKENSYGAKWTTEHKRDGQTITWNHFWGSVGRKFKCSAPDKELGEFKTQFHTMERGLRELDPGALVTVLDLIREGTLYRGAEYKAAIELFQKTQREHLHASNKDAYIWKNLSGAVAGFRNTAIGTLIQDLSEGTPLEDAVRKFEVKVAPMNYRRTTALVTTKMIDQALTKIKDLDLEETIYRRFAVISDIKVRDVLFVDNKVRNRMKGESLRESLILGSKPVLIDTKKAQVITISDFMDFVVPLARGMKALVQNDKLGNFVSLTAPKGESEAKLLAWDNNFAWSYQGEVTDSIKERVKKAGGNIDADLRVSLAWSNFDDLDLHAKCPDGDIYYGNKRNILDVDMNAGMSETRSPVENLSWKNPQSGLYRISVNQFNKRETSDIGFSLELESKTTGLLKHFTYKVPMRDGKTVDCFSFNINGRLLSNLRVGDVDLRDGLSSQEIWGIKTEGLIPVSILMKSPNHWDGSKNVGQRHWFFMLEGCKNPNSVRGFYNEFLRKDLIEHRKVFEMISAKTKCEPTDDQLSGIGFSEGRKDNLVVSVDFENTERMYNIQF